jgi:hypothetical protein
MRGGGLPRIALGRAIRDRRGAREPPVPQRHESRARFADHPSAPWSQAEATDAVTTTTRTNPRDRQDPSRRGLTIPPIMAKTPRDHAPASRSGSLRPWRRAGC